MSNKYSSLKLKHIHAELHGNVGVVVLNRPEKRNAFTMQMNAEISSVYEIMDEDPQVRVIVLTGAENKGNVFCAGADLSIGNFASGGMLDEQKAKKATPRRPISIVSSRLRKPTIAAINGHAVGVGVTLTLPLDIRITWKDAKMGFVFPRRGIVPEAVCTYFLPRLIGYSAALSILTRGEMLLAKDKIFGNLFYDLLDSPDQVFPAAMRLATEMANSNSSLSMAVTKALVWNSATTPEGQHILDTRALDALGNTTESKELVKAFLEKKQGPIDDSKRTTVQDWPETFPQWWTVPDTSSHL